MKSVEFYQELSGLLGKGWRAFINHDGEIRLKTKHNKTYCPITAVCQAKTGKSIPVYNADKAATFLKLHHDTADTIMNAADYSDLSTPSRQKLTTVLGL